MTEPAAMLASALADLRRSAQWSVRPLTGEWNLEVGVTPTVEWAGYLATVEEASSGFVVRDSRAFLSGPWISAAVGFAAYMRRPEWADETVWVAMDAAAFRARGSDHSAVTQVGKYLPDLGATVTGDVTVDQAGLIHLDMAVPFGLGQRWTRCTVALTGDGAYRFVSIGTAGDGPAAVFIYEDVEAGLRVEGQVLTSEEALTAVRARKARRPPRTPELRLATVELMPPEEVDEEWTLVVTGHHGAARRSRAAGYELDLAVREWLAARGDGALPLTFDTSSDELFITSPSREALERVVAALTADHGLG